MDAELKLKKIAAVLGVEPFDCKHARHNLDGAYDDLKRTGKADAVCFSTINRVLEQLDDVERILGC